MSRPVEQAETIDETILASCLACSWRSDDEDLALIMAVGHQSTTGHEVAVTTSRTEILKGKR